jgi:flagellar protein FlaG
MDVKPVAHLQPSVEMNSQSLEIKNQQQLKRPEVHESQNIDSKKKEKATQTSPEVIEKIIEDLKKKLSMLNTQLEIQIDKDTDIVVVKVIDRETNKVIRQIPPEYVLKIAKYLDEIAGLLYNEKV